jgi:LacI family transcriptional regulator
MATIYDVCKEAGVSMATVSRVINGSESVRQGTRQKVLDAMHILGYQPSQIAQSLATKRTNSIGLQVSELYGPFYGPMMAGVEHELRLGKKQVFITSGHSDEAQEQTGIESLLARNCDALILHVEAVSDEYLINLSKGRTPFVLLNRYIEDLADNCIVLDNFHGGYIRTRYLLESGHRDIAYISGPLWKNDASQRLGGHKKALKEFGIEFDEAGLYEGVYQEETGIAGVKYFLDNGIKMSAIVCGNDEIAFGAMDMSRKAGMAVPEDISIAGFDDVNLAYYMHPKLTTVKYPIENMARMAARWVLANVYNQDINVNNTFIPDLVLRDSCQSLATNRAPGS